MDNERRIIAIHNEYNEKNVTFKNVFVTFLYYCRKVKFKVF